MSRRIMLVLLLAVLSLPGTAAAQTELRVAVASNFAPVLARLVAEFEAGTGHRVIMAPGATGRHYTQIVNGAPFDLFLAADAERPQLLEESGRAVAGTRFVYALGKLVLWSPDPDLIDGTSSVLVEAPFRYLSIANPRLAPYGVAAQQVLQSLGQWENLAQRLVQGATISKELQFVLSGNAALGFLARSQWLEVDADRLGSAVEVPDALYDALGQEALLLRDT